MTRERTGARRSGAAVRRVPTRSCVACRTARDKRDLVRIVRTPDGAMMIDETGRLAGRGAYLCRDAGCWTLAAGRGALGRALEAPVPPDLRERLLAGPDTMTMTSGGGARGQE
ncbi:MAG TPA: YlxR family protein [Candidatus Limnocylindrales bacterium]|nr:YlxR family protein [Candidatus Limnocylindrales bacterium]